MKPNQRYQLYAEADSHGSSCPVTGPRNGPSAILFRMGYRLILRIREAHFKSDRPPSAAHGWEQHDVAEEFNLIAFVRFSLISLTGSATYLQGFSQPNLYEPFRVASGHEQPSL